MFLLQADKSLLKILFLYTLCFKLSVSEDVQLKEKIAQVLPFWLLYFVGFDFFSTDQISYVCHSMSRYHLDYSNKEKAICPEKTICDASVLRYKNIWNNTVVDTFRSSTEFFIWDQCVTHFRKIKLSACAETQHYKVFHTSVFWNWFCSGKRKKNQSFFIWCLQ